jgi:hypothetical protein
MKDPLSVVTETARTFSEETERTIKPVRESLVKRFPILFTLVVTFGVALTFFGLERLFGVFPLTNNHPLGATLVGIGILAFTGKLYAKLG